MVIQESIKFGITIYESSLEWLPLIRECRKLFEVFHRYVQRRPIDVPARRVDQTTCNPIKRKRERTRRTLWNL